MTIVNILRDGTVYPPLKQDELIVKLLNGDMQVGRYDRIRYINEAGEYITEPQNAIDLKKDLIKLINAEMPELFSKRYIVHLLCPVTISQKMQWAPCL